MNVSDYLGLLHRFWISIVVLTSAGLLAGVVGYFITPPTYDGSSAVFVSVRDGETAREVLGGANYAAGQVLSYATVAVSPLVLQPVIDRVQLETTPALLVKEQLVKASMVSNTTIIVLSAKNSDAVKAAQISQAMAEELVAAVDKLSPADPGGGRLVKATVITPAAVPIEPSQPQFAQYAMVGLLVGLGVGLVQALARGAFRRSPAESD